MSKKFKISLELICLLLIAFFVFGMSLEGYWGRCFIRGVIAFFGLIIILIFDLKELYTESFLNKHGSKKEDVYLSKQVPFRVNRSIKIFLELTFLILVALFIAEVRAGFFSIKGYNQCLISLGLAAFLGLSIVFTCDLTEWIKERFGRNSN